MEEKDQRDIAMACLEEICRDADAKDADRIAASKLLLEHGQKKEDEAMLTVVMEGIPKEFCK